MTEDRAARVRYGLSVGKDSDSYDAMHATGHLVALVAIPMLPAGLKKG